MRQIKFRGKSVGDIGAWIYGYYHYDKFVKKHYICSEDLIRHEVIEETVGQRTGMKDKNVKDIYEGDELECYDDNIYHPSIKKSEIIWCDKMCKFKLNHQSNTFEYYATIEVVGNIHDNP